MASTGSYGPRCYLGVQVYLKYNVPSIEGHTDLALKMNLYALQGYT